MRPLRLARAARAWGRPEFRSVLKAEIESLGTDDLPLRQALCSGNLLPDQAPGVMINGFEQRDGAIVARVGLFFAGVDGGSCCAGDPTTVEPHPEYCEVEFEIDRAGGDATVRLLDS